jgi:hypothetical protein
MTKKVDPQDIHALRRADSYMTLQAIADRVGVTRERVRQILREARLPTVAQVLYKHHCALCGGRISAKHRRHRACLREIAPAPVLHSCPTCGRDFNTPQYVVTYRDKDGRYKGGWFCSRRCHGKAWRKFKDGDRVQYTGSWVHIGHAATVIGYRRYKKGGSVYNLQCCCGRELFAKPSTIYLDTTDPGV